MAIYTTGLHGIIKLGEQSQISRDGETSTFQAIQITQLLFSFPNLHNQYRFNALFEQQISPIFPIQSPIQCAHRV